MPEADNMFDAFAAYGETRAPARKAPSKPKVVTSEADAPMKPSAMEQAQRDKSALLRNYRRSKKQDHEAMLAGKHGSDYAQLVAITKQLPESSKCLLEHLQRPWVAELTPIERMSVLSIINARIILERLKQGLAPLSDPLPGQPDNLSLRCRKLIQGY